MWDSKNGHKQQATLNIWKAEHNKQTGWCSECSLHQNHWCGHSCEKGYWQNAWQSDTSMC